MQHKMETDGNHEKNANVGVLAENYFFHIFFSNRCLKKEVNYASHPKRQWLFLVAFYHQSNEA